MSEIADKLDEARALIEKGWTQGAFRKGDCVCTLGALNEAFRFAEGDAARRARDVGYGFVARAAGVGSLTDWNDAPERTQAEVIEAFRKAAELARSEAAAVGGR